MQGDGVSHLALDIRDPLDHVGKGNGLRPYKERLPCPGGPAATELLPGKAVASHACCPSTCIWKARMYRR